jgi:hypothetical protein
MTLDSLQSCFGFRNNTRVSAPKAFVSHGSVVCSAKNNQRKKVASDSNVLSKDAIS